MSHTGITILIITFYFAATAAGCTAGPPEIYSANVSEIVRYNPTNGTTAVSASVFLEIDDTDGIQDIDTIWILSDSSQLLWILTASVWETISIDGKNYIGSSRLVSPILESIPRGRLRIIVQDKAGNKGTFETGLGSSQRTQAPVPSLTKRGNALRVNSLGTGVTELSVRDWADNELQRHELKQLDIPFENILNGKAISDYRFFLTRINQGASFIEESGPWSFTDVDG